MFIIFIIIIIIKIIYSNNSINIYLRVLNNIKSIGQHNFCQKKIESLFTTLPSKDHLQLKGQSKYFKFYWETTHTLSRKKLQNVKKRPEETDSSSILYANNDLNKQLTSSSFEEMFSLIICDVRNSSKNVRTVSSSTFQTITMINFTITSFLKVKK